MITEYWERAEFPFELVPKIAALNLGGATMKGYGCPVRGVGGERARPCAPPRPPQQTAACVLPRLHSPAPAPGASACLLLISTPSPTHRCRPPTHATIHGRPHPPCPRHPLPPQGLSIMANAMATVEFARVDASVATFALVSARLNILCGGRPSPSPAGKEVAVKPAASCSAARLQRLADRAGPLSPRPGHHQPMRQPSHNPPALHPRLHNTSAPLPCPPLPRCTTSWRSSPLGSSAPRSRRKHTWGRWRATSRWARRLHGRGYVLARAQLRGTRGRRLPWCSPRHSLHAGEGLTVLTPAPLLTPAPHQTHTGRLLGADGAQQRQRRERADLQRDQGAGRLGARRPEALDRQRHVGGRRRRVGSQQRDGPGAAAWAGLRGQTVQRAAALGAPVAFTPREPQLSGPSALHRSLDRRSTASSSRRARPASARPRLRTRSRCAACRTQTWCSSAASCPTARGCRVRRTGARLGCTPGLAGPLAAPGRPWRGLRMGSAALAQLTVLRARLHTRHR